MKVALICKSDSTGGAAVVSRRLAEALRASGVEASLVVEEKLSGLPYVVKADYPLRKPASFIAERLQILINNGFSRRNLWKVDTASFGLPLWELPAIKEADAVILNWVNQGMLSLKGVRRIAQMGKRMVWTMHDMWNMTGICHHALGCRRFEKDCGRCPFLKRKPDDLSARIWTKKSELYESVTIRFVAVSNWLAEEAKKSALLGAKDIAVIPNPFRPQSVHRDGGGHVSSRGKSAKTILFAAASLDNWIKGLDTFREAVNILAQRNPGEDLRVALLGACSSPEALEGFALPVTHLGTVTDEGRLAEIFSGADTVVNTSVFENLPGTLVEGQAYGAVPVAFDRGGQRDIIDHLHTGYLAPWSDDRAVRARNIADGIEWALREGDETRERMKKSVEDKFSYETIADKYIGLIGGATCHTT